MGRLTGALSNKRHSNRKQCSYCGVTLTPGGILPLRKQELLSVAEQMKANARRTWDHIVPASVGGKLCIPCCAWCNNQKGDRSLGDWLHSDELALRCSMIAQREDAEPMHPKLLEQIKDEDLTRIRRILEYHSET